MEKKPEEDFMNTNKFIILSTENHPLYKQLKKICDQKGYRFYDVEKDELFEKKQENQRECECLFDFTLTPTEQKMGLLSYLDFEFDCAIISDLSVYWGEVFFQKVKHLSGAVSTVFTSPTNTREAYVENELTKSYIENLYQSLELKALFINDLEIGFTFPRVISMIMNEAYFSLEDELASDEDIDRAMKYGVNYPLGPIEWSQEIGATAIVMLLDELYQVTGDSRYRVSKLLRLMASS
jgi:3-hydroxybutyryl-CoA dehydrogenase